jgi:hypothetical protein
MTLAARLARFCVDFVVGDDLRLAAGIAVALAVSAALAASGIPAWWFLPLAVAALLAESIARAGRR